MRVKNQWLRIATVLVVMLGLSAATSPAFAQDEPVDEVLPELIIDDVTEETFGSGGGGEPVDLDVPAPPANGEGGADQLAASTDTRTLTRTKKIPAAAFSGPTMSFANGGGCAYPSNGNSAAYAAVTGLPQGAIITEMFAEVFAESAEAEDLTLALKWADGGDGSSGTMASAVSNGGNFTNLQDVSITNGVVNGLGSSGRSYFLVFDADNNSLGDVDYNDHRVCHVWITYTITETYLTDVFSFVPITPCAELDTRPGQPGYTASEGGIMVPGETRTIDMTTATCNVPIPADGFVVSAFLINTSGVNWLNIYDASLPNNDEAVIVGSTTDPLESVSLLVGDSALSGDDIKLTMGGTPGAGAHVKLVITGYYTLDNQPSNRYTD